MTPGDAINRLEADMQGIRERVTVLESSEGERRRELATRPNWAAIGSVVLAAAAVLATLALFAFQTKTEGAVTTSTVAAQAAVQTEFKAELKEQRRMLQSIDRNLVRLGGRFNVDMEPAKEE